MKGDIWTVCCLQQTRHQSLPGVSGHSVESRLSDPFALKLNEMFPHIEYMLRPLVDESIELAMLQPDEALIVMVLKKAGYRIIEAADGTEALEIFSRNQDAVELLLLDIMMPEKNGLKVYAEIKKTVPDMKVLFVSGYTGKIPEVQGGDEALLVEGEPLLYKPVVPDDLLRKVRAIIDT
jgi:CheY-like chemotaxis protein